MTSTDGKNITSTHDISMTSTQRYKHDNKQDVAVLFKKICLNLKGRQEMQQVANEVL